VTDPGVTRYNRLTVANCVRILRAPTAFGEFVKNPLALHTWTLDTTPLGSVLDIVKTTGWQGIELRRLDFKRAADAGQPAEAPTTVFMKLRSISRVAVTSAITPRRRGEMTWTLCGTRPTIALAARPTASTVLSRASIAMMDGSSRATPTPGT